MKPSERRKKIQELLGVSADGIFGPKTTAAFNELAVRKDTGSISGRDWDGQYSDELGGHYEVLFRTMQVRGSARPQLEQIVSAALLNRKRYLEVSRILNVPWYFIAAIHSLESSQNFNAHLHNGDPLKARTVNVPKGRPVEGTPPFTWEESALDAIRQKKFHQETDWSIGHMLYRLEVYNGIGYRKYHPNVPSPYLWSGSSHYNQGKYVSDGKWSETAVSKQIGAALIIAELIEPLPG